MKKTTLFGAAFFAAMSVMTPQMMAQEIPSASTTVYDFSGWDGRNMLKLFAAAADEGRAYPTKAEFEAAGIYLDLEFARSHTRYQPIIAQSAETNLVPDVFATRRLWMNLPTGAGKGTGGYPTGEFASDVYTMWNYTHVFGSWNHGFMQAPGSWVDAGHKNGTYMYSGIEFFDYASGNQSAYTDFIAEKKANGEYKYLDAVLNCLLFLGQDGINYNFEQGAPNDKLVAFHSALYKRAKEIGFDNFHIGAYTNYQTITAGNAYQLLGDNKKVLSDYSSEPLGHVHDAFLNYSGGDFAWSGVANSLSAAKAAVGTAENVYQGVWIVTMDRNWKGMNTATTKEMNLVLWGEHSESRFWQFNVGTSQMNAQENYQILQDRTTGGGKRNVLDRPAIANSGHNFQVMAHEQDKQMATWAGFASMIPERSAIQGNLPFNTYFSLGNGEIYFYKGKKTHGSWYNMAQQDYVPTYRWLLTKKGDMKTKTTDALDVRFSHEEGYVGGNSIRLSGAAAGSDLVIYKTNLNVTGAVTATVALKNLAGAGASHLSLILQKADGSWVETPYGNTTAGTWEEKTLNVNGLASGDVIKHIGVRIEGAPETYKLYLGQIKLNDGSAAKTPAPIAANSFVAEVKKETAKNLSVKLNWSVDDAGYTTEFKERGMVFNDEVNIDHFELFIKNGEDGKVVEVGRPTGWHGFIGDIDLDTYADPYIGVRSVSTDLVSASDVEWIRIERYADPTKLPVAKTDLYMPTYMDPTSNGLEAAYTSRWIEELKTTGATGNLNYVSTEPAGSWTGTGDTFKPAEDNTNYVMAEDVLTVKQGEKVTFHIRGHKSSDGIKYCLFKAFIDWDIDYEFDGSNDEMVWNFGTTNHGASPVNDGGTTRDKFETEGVDFVVNVPADAREGRSRLRIVACDAWFAGGLNATGAFNKGFALDVPVEIVSAGNEQRQPKPGYKELRDKGEADSPEFSAIGSVAAENGVSTVTVVDNVAYFTNADKAWFYDMNGRVVKFVADATASANVADLAAGVYVVKMQNGQVIRAAKVVVK
ncbi:MAG: T9SS type A sorting domain-containing protein [Firmicutes bacterium]|nr:T9SS type A sorting domain-containing protein [Bacillota bacterium]MCM1401528.1 T9SS type A sorting domain-containing protein [Bacteroides sp.]MCM1476574.1 T9SS type A sorting domain-containing protein [Bacteroides sp.]